MAKPVWQQKIQNKLTEKPMCFVRGTVTVKHVACLAPSEQAGKMITLRYITNSSKFNTCATCKKSVH